MTRTTHRLAVGLGTVALSFAVGVLTGHGSIVEKPAYADCVLADQWFPYNCEGSIWCSDGDIRGSVRGPQPQGGGTLDPSAPPPVDLTIVPPTCLGSTWSIDSIVLTPKSTCTDPRWCAAPVQGLYIMNLDPQTQTWVRGAWLLGLQPSYSGLDPDHAYEYVRHMKADALVSTSVQP